MQSDKPADYLYKKLFHRSKYRGTKELDILIGAFAEQHLHSFSAADLLLILRRQYYTMPYLVRRYCPHNISTIFGEKYMILCIIGYKAVI